jgi:hypothetical protein
VGALPVRRGWPPSSHRLTSREWSTAIARTPLSLSLSLAGWLAIAGTEVRAQRGCSRCWLLSRNLEARATTIAEQCGWSYV